MVHSKLHHRRLALCVAWALALSFSLSACDEEEEEDCALTNLCGDPSQAPRVDTSKYLDFYNFIPDGTFAIKTAKGDVARFVSKNKDGSLITADIEWDESSKSHKTVSRWKVWHDDMYYWVTHDLIGEKDNKIDRFYTLSLKHPDSSVTAPKEMSISTTLGGWPSGQVSDATGMFLFYYNFAAFVNDPKKDKAVYEKDEAVAGIPCKKYSYSTDFGGGFTTKREWWVLGNGFCLKSNFYMNGELEGVQSFEAVLAEFDTKTYDGVTQKYARFRSQIKDEIPPVAEMIKATEGVAGGAWIAPSGYLPWTAGGIDFMINFRALNWKNYPVANVHVAFKEGTMLEEATEAYKAAIMAIPSMRQLESSWCLTDATYDTGCTWKYDNQTDDCGDGYSYFKYQIQTQGAGGENYVTTPTMPMQIFMGFTPVICV